jgi:hypothetical protein
MENHKLMLKGQANWNVWKFQTTVVLKSRSLFDVVAGVQVKPQQEDGKSAEIYEKELKEFTTKDSKAQELLVTSVEEQVLVHLLTCESAKEMWDKLLSIYEKKSEVSLHLLQQKFFNLKFESESVAEFISKLQDICSRLKSMGENVSENMQITKILMSLPDEYKFLATAWESVPAEKQSVNELISRLMVEEERLKTSSSTENNEASETRAFVVNASHGRQFTGTKDKGKSNTGNACTVPVAGKSSVKCFSCGGAHFKRYCSQQQSEKNKRVCNFCRKPGHVFKDCFLRLGKEKVGYKNQKSSNAFLSAYISGEANDTDWFVDSGATEHMCCNKEMFATYRSLHVQWSVKIGDGSEIFALGVGSVKIKAFNGNQWVDSVIENVLYVPALKLNLFSVCAVTDKGYNLVSNSKECRFEKDNEVKCIGIREGKLYKMMFRLKYRYENSAHVSVEITKTRLTLKEWHEKLAHQHAAQVRKILLKHGIDFVDEFFFCEACTKGKQHRLPFPSSKTKTERPCELIHADLAGPMEVASLGGSRYFLLLKDDVSHYRTVYFLKNKNQVQGQLEIFLNKVENETGSKVKILRTDNGLEFVNREVQKLLQDRGVAHQRTVHYTPEQNGKAEREMRTIVEAARTVLQARNLNKEMWAEAVHYVTYILNNSGTSEVQGKFPTEVWSGKPVSKEIIENFHIFGSEVWVHIPKQKRLKWDPKSECCIFVGYDLNTKGYRVFLSQK